MSTSGLRFIVLTGGGALVLAAATAGVGAERRQEAVAPAR